MPKIVLCKMRRTTPFFSFLPYTRRVCECVSTLYRKLFVAKVVYFLYFYTHCARGGGGGGGGGGDAGRRDQRLYAQLYVRSSSIRFETVHFLFYAAA